MEQCLVSKTLQFLVGSTSRFTHKNFSRSFRRLRYLSTSMYLSMYAVCAQNQYNSNAQLPKLQIVTLPIARRREI